MAEHDDGLVVSKTSTVSIEGLKVSLAPGGSISPSTITVMCGMAANAAATATGAALSISSSVTDAVSSMSDYAASVGGVLGTNISSAAAALEDQANKVLGGMSGFFNQAMSHVTDCEAIKSVTDFMSDVDFPDLGSGITDMASMAEHGLSATLGSLSAASSVMQEVGKVYNVADMATFGAAGGLVSSLVSNKLANHSGLIDELGHAGVDINQINDPAFLPQINNALAKITDPLILNDITSHFGLSGSSISNLADLTNLDKFNIPDASSLVGGLSGLSSKLGDLGASFSNPLAAADMLGGMELPSIPLLSDYAPSLSELADKLNPCIEKTTGTGTSGLGIPSIDDFMSTVNGNAITDSFKAAFDAGTGITQGMVDELNTHLDYVSDLYDKAGMDLANPPVPKLASIAAFASSLHTHGANPVASACLAKLSNPDSISGQAVISSLAEGKNKALMAVNGISPIKFG